MITWALRYIRLGWAVIPLKGKIPLVEHGSKDATLNEKQAREWWSRWPEANIGIATGQRFFVVDIDVAKGGEQSWDMLRASHGALPDTIEQTTGTGGQHLLYLMPDFTVRNSESLLAPGLDIRGVGGYIVAPPSIHPVTRHPYSWDGMNEIEHRAIAPAPAWLLKLLQANEHRRKGAAAPVLQKIPKGKQHSTLVSIAGSMRRRGLGSDAIFAALEVVNREQCTEPGPAENIRRIAESIARYAPDASADVFRRLRNAQPDEEIALSQVDVEAAVQLAITNKDLRAAVDLAPVVAPLSKAAHALITAKLRVAFGNLFPTKQFETVLREGSGSNVVQMPAHGPPSDGEGTPDIEGPDLREFPFTDSGNAQRLLALYGKDLRYCTEMKEWLVWDGKRWQVDVGRKVTYLAQRMARKLYEQAVGVAGVSAFARKSEMNSAIKAMCERAISQPDVCISAAELDRHPYLLNCLNGVVDLRSGTLLPHDRNYLITKLCPLQYDQDAKCPRFLEFLHWAMGDTNPEAESPPQALRLVAYLQRIFGYSLTGDTTGKCVFVFHGHSANNGKTTLVETFKGVVGSDYSAVISIKSLMVRGPETTYDLVDLRGTRFASASESQEGEALNEAMVKAMTAGGGEIKARGLYQNFLRFPETHHLFIDCNHRPRIRGTDNGIWDRLRLIPFNSRVSDEDRDLDLKYKLLAEAPGILAWAVRGSRDWIEKKRLDEPEEVAAGTRAWKEHDDPLREFVEDCCEIEDAEGWEQCSRVSAAYAWWCKKNSERYPVGRVQFFERMRGKGFRESRSRRDGDGRQLRTWEGFRLKADVWELVSAEPNTGRTMF